MKRITKLEESKLFSRLNTAPADDVDARQRLASSVRDVVKQAKWISDQICRFLPQYTLHNETHLFNVLSIMEELLPAATLKHLSPLECALCILATFTHDLGMALSDGEHRRLMDDASPSDERREFLRHRADRFAEQERQIERLRKLNTDESRRKAALLEGHIVGDFLRRTHASNVGRVLGWFKRIRQETGNQALFTYGNLDFEHRLAQIAMSHNQEAHWLREQLNKASGRPDGFFSRAGAGEHVNLAFPGVLLRLADYMDFDATRAPAILFHHFGIDDAISVREWEKHMAITGWELDLDEQPPRLTYEAANCAHPVFEKTIREFVRDIEQEARRTRDELDHQRRLLGKKGDPYDVHVPAQVDPRVTPKVVNGRPCYVYHDWQFQLDQDEIQELLMGETLWGDPTLAIRELLQNALDALQMRDLRMQLLRKQPNAPVEPTDFLPEGEELAVRLTWGQDAATGQEFIRVSDNGTGMTKTVLERFFTQIGKSYYRSPDFAREQALLRSHGHFATPISHFGIGILSCFMIGDRLEVRTRPGRADEHDRQPFDVTVSGPGSLFWLRPGTLEKQGTEVTVYLKARFKLSTNPKKLLKALRQHFEYEERDSQFREQPEQEGNATQRHPLNPALVAAKDVIWPMYLVLMGPDGQRARVRLDDRYHIEVLNPIDKARVAAKAKEWGCPKKWLGKLRWQTFDWVDDQGTEATGSRIRFIFPCDHKNAGPGPSDSPVTAHLCRQHEVASFVECTLTTRSRSLLLVKGMAVENTDQAFWLLPVAAKVGSYLWVDLRGKASPKLTADRKVALRPNDLGETVKGLFQRWMNAVRDVVLANPDSAIHWQNQLAWQRRSWPSADFLASCRIHLSAGLKGSWPEGPVQAFWGSEAYIQQVALGPGPLFAYTLDRDPDLARAVAFATARAAARTFDFGLAGIRHATGSLYSLFGCARALVLGTTPRRDLALVLQIPRAFVDACLRTGILGDIRAPRPEEAEDAMALTDALSEASGIRGCFRDALRLSFFNEAFQPSLETSFPPLGCTALRGRVGDGLLVAPAIIDFATAPDGRTVTFADPSDTQPRPLAAYGYDLVFPITAIPMGRLRQGCERWRTERAWRAMGVLPFLLLGWQEGCEKLAWDLRENWGIGVPTILALMPCRELWDRPFADWTRHDWENCGLTALWDLATGQVLWAKGAHNADEMRQVGKPIRDFVAQLTR